MASVGGAVGRVIVLPDGRTLSYREYGDPAGHPVIALHGTPGSGFKYSGSHDAAVRVGLRLLAVDRWGYGGTSAKPGARLSDYGADIAALADALKIARFGITGVSGGAPYAAATAALLKDRVTALALVSPVGPISGQVPEIKLSPFHTLCFQVLPRIPGGVAGVFTAFRAGLAVSPKRAMAIAVRRSAPADQLAMANDDTRSQLSHAFITGLAPGVQGPKTDLTLFKRPWGIDLKSITAPACIWMGSEDRNVPMTSVTALSAALANCETVLIPGAGHLWVTSHADVVMGWLAGASCAHDAAAEVKRRTRPTLG